MAIKLRKLNQNASYIIIGVCVIISLLMVLDYFVVAKEIPVVDSSEDPPNLTEWVAVGDPTGILNFLTDDDSFIGQIRNTAAKFLTADIEILTYLGVLGTLIRSLLVFFLIIGIVELIWIG